MTKQTVKPIVGRLALVSACVLYLTGCVGSVALGPDVVKGQTPDGTVEMQEVQAAYIGSGSTGTGILSLNGVQYPFESRGGRGRRLRPLDHRRDGRDVQPPRARAVPRHLWPGPLRLCDRHRAAAAISGCRTSRA